MCVYKRFLLPHVWTQAARKGAFLKQKFTGLRKHTPDLASRSRLHTGMLATMGMTRMDSFIVDTEGVQLGRPIFEVLDHPAILRFRTVRGVVPSCFCRDCSLGRAVWPYRGSFGRVV